MQITIVTGMSGSGKTHVIRFMEDMGFFCIDNMPPLLISKFSEMLTASGKFQNVAIVVDIRVGDLINSLLEQVHELRKDGFNVKILFLNANDATLVKRYKETRRSHPIDDPNGLLASIRRERAALSVLLGEADYVIDTSEMTTTKLQSELKEIFSDENTQGIEINVCAFGFKYGIPLDADLVFDVRCFPNPFYVPELKKKNGNDAEVRDYVMKSDKAREFMKRLDNMIEFLIPLYEEEGKKSLSIAIGCTGGKHRSITMANELADFLKEKKYNASATYRDIGKE